MKAMPRLLETGPAEVRDLLEAGISDAPSPQLLPALRAAVAASVVVSGVATTVAASTSGAANATTSGAFAKVANGVVAAKTAVPFVAAKSLLVGIVVGSALCSGAILTGVLQKPAPRVVERSEPSLSVRSQTDAKVAGTRSGRGAHRTFTPSPPESGEGRRGLAARADDEPADATRRSSLGGAARTARPAPSAPSRRPPASEPMEEELVSVSPAPAPTTEASSRLALEIRQVDQARALLKAGQPDAALSALQTYERMSPSAVLRREALILRVEAQLARGDAQSARSLAAGYVARYPNDVHVGRMKEIAGEGSSVE